MFLLCSIKFLIGCDVMHTPGSGGFGKKYEGLRSHRDVIRQSATAGTNRPHLQFSFRHSSQPAGVTGAPTKRTGFSETRNALLTTEFLRRQAENCLRIARSCFDLASAERLRLMANDLKAK